MRSAVFAGSDPSRLHCVGTARSCGISGNIETGKLVVAEFLMASHRSRRNIYCATKLSGTSIEPLSFITRVDAIQYSWPVE